MKNLIIAFYQKHFLTPVVRELNKGLVAEKFVQAIVAGILIGIFPFYGTTTLLAIIIAFIFRLNQVVVQACNYALYPIQLLLMLPLFSLGGWVLGADDHLLEMIKAGSFWQQLNFSVAIQLIIQGFIGWLIIAIPVGIASSLILKKILYLKGFRKFNIFLQSN